jgi:uncharacterized membrane protein YeaQ/YmgE (transglycosylase-associated protein family)
MTRMVWFLLIGLCAGWLAGRFTQGKGFGLWGNLVVGVVGAVIGVERLVQRLGLIGGPLRQALGQLHRGSCPQQRTIERA